MMRDGERFKQDWENGGRCVFVLHAQVVEVEHMLTL